jgi:hypothetical protein
VAVYNKWKTEIVRLWSFSSRSRSFLSLLVSLQRQERRGGGRGASVFALNLFDNVSRGSSPRATDSSSSEDYRMIQNHVATLHEESTVSMSTELNSI